MALYKIETAHGGHLEGGRFLDFYSRGVDTIDAVDEWLCERTGAETTEEACALLGIERDDLTARDVSEED